MKNLPKDKDAGIRKLPNNVQEKMGYDPLSQERSMIAGGSRPMHQASTVQVDPMTGLPLQANAPAMGNFGGAMGMSNVPMYDQSMSPGAIAQSRKLGEAAGKFGVDMINKKLMKEERFRAEDISQGDQGYRSSQYVPNPNPIKNLDVGLNMTGKHSAQAKSLDRRNIKGVEVFGGNQPTEQSGLGAIVKLPQEKAPIIQPQNPGVYKGVNLNKPLPIKADFYGAGGKEYDNPELKKGIVGKETSPSAHTALDQSELFWRKTAHNVASDKTESGKGISGRALGELMHLERHGQTSRLQNGPLSSPTEKIKKGFKKGWEETYAKPKS
mgnify:FL=1